MRIGLSILLIILTSFNFSNAQSFKMGVTGGLNSARIDGDAHDIWGKLGLNGGLFVERDILPELLSWQIEIKYTARGKYQGPTNIDPGINIIDLKYMELPVGMNVFFNKQISAGFGIDPDVLISERHFDENGLLPNISPIYGSSEVDNNFYFGLTAYANLNYFFSEIFAAEIRFNYSVFPFYRFDAYAVRYRDSGFFHDVLSINLKYYL